ncbi:MAG: PAS domain S-box protein [Planctomycetota bacterium]
MNREPASESRTGSDQFHVVGIGASAGGLEAIEALFQGMPLRTGLAFVVVQHLSPDFKSHMEELLSRKTQIPIHRVVDGIEVQPDSIYLIPAKMEMVISGRRLRLTERSPDRSLSHPIDQFFRSLANDLGKYSVGVVLSGTGSDGSRGIRDIKQAGGLVIAQDGGSAKFDGMPLNAVATGVVDLVLPPASIPEALTRYIDQRLSPEALSRSKEELESSTTGVDKVFELLRMDHSVDFSHYKASTVGRRVHRRMQLHSIESIEDYCTFLERSPEELENLYKDLLIGVTEFFRDEEAFELLETRVIPELMPKVRETGAFRVWIAGCASGEEAYSIAILIDEALRREGVRAEAKIFATDIHHGSLAIAGAGVYPEEALEKLSQERRSRYFVARRDQYEVGRHLRSMVVFARHNVFNDAPFTQLSLICCRNLLIYLQPLAQKKALSLFHFALRTGGALFLGPSETPGDLSDEFETLSSRWRIYRKRRDVRLPIDTRLPFTMSSAAPEPAPALVPKGSTPTALESQWLSIYDRLLDLHMPSSVLLDEDHTVLQVFGGAERYLTYRGGRQSSDILSIIDENLETPLSGAIQHAIRENTEVQYTGLSTTAEHGGEALKILVRPLHDPRTNVMRLLVTFAAEREPKEASSESKGTEVDVGEATQERIVSLETELRYTRENLQATIEELETSNEELQATNEEMLASNEELQSTNEELQSVNEELYTVNTEHQKKIDELTRAHDDMDNLLALTRVGVIFLDEDLTIRRFTPEIGRLFHLMPQDIGRPFEGFEHNLVVEGLSEWLTEVLEEGRQIEKRIEDRRRNPFLLRIAPYLRGDTVRGVALTLIDVRDLEAAQRDVVMFKDMAEQAADMLFLVDRNGTIRYANPAAWESTRLSEEELIGTSFSRLFPTDRPLRVPDLIEASSSNKGGFQFETELVRRNGTRFQIGITVNPVRLGQEILLFAAARDISEQKATEQRLLLYRSAIDATMSGVSIADARLPDYPLVYVNESFARISGYSIDEVLGKNCRFLQGPATDAEHRRKLHDAIDEGRHTRVTIRNYRKDGTPFWNDVSLNPVRGEDGDVDYFVGVQDDVTRNVESDIERRDQEARLRALFNSTAEGILGIDPEGRCTFSNESARRMLQHSAEDVVGRPIAEVVGWKERHLPELEEALEQIEGDEPARLMGQKFWRSDGMMVPVEICVQPIEVDDQRLGNVLTFEDITERTLQAKKLELAQRQAEAANRAKSEFLANMSHEIRTPLAAVMAFAELLRLEVKSHKEKDFVSAIDRNVRALLDIVNDILDLSKVEAERLEMHVEEVDVPELISDIRSFMEMRAEEADLSLDIECETPIPKVIQSDRARLRQVLMNLVGNALKFTERGGVQIRLAHFEPKRLLEIVVTDTGIGIAPELVDRLFQPFEQGDPSIARKSGGTGLGLSITKKLVERMGGTIRIESEPNRGSSFAVRIPTGELAPDASFTESISQVTKKDRPDPPLLRLNGHVLVVDDQEDIRKGASELLRSAGCDVSAVSSGPDALRFLEREGSRVDAMLLDLHMPQMSGFEVLDRVRSSDDPIPVIAFTAQAMKGERERCLQAGFTDYLSKPIDRETLIHTLQTHLEEAAADALRILVIEDHSDAGRALKILLGGEKRTIEIAASGAEAYALAKQMEPHVCILDRGLPDCDGIDLAKQLRELPGGSRVVQIALSGRPLPEAETKGLFDYRLVKPVDMDELEGILSRLESRICGSGS